MDGTFEMGVLPCKVVCACNPVLKRLSREEGEFKVSLGWLARLCIFKKGERRKEKEKRGGRKN